MTLTQFIEHSPITQKQAEVTAHTNAIAARSTQLSNAQTNLRTSHVKPLDKFCNIILVKAS